MSVTIVTLGERKQERSMPVIIATDWHDNPGGLVLLNLAF